MSRACCVYAIVGRDTPLPSQPGTGAGTLARVQWRDLAAITSGVTDGSATATADAVLRHVAIVEAVRREGRAIPVRFGTVFRDTGDVASAIARRYEPLAADLDRVGDKVEMGVTALWSSPPSPPEAERAEIATASATSDGARYLHARAAENRRTDALQARAQAVADSLALLLGPSALERRLSLRPTRGIALRATYLLAPHAVAAFRQAFEEARASVNGVRLLLTGPWPPYSFVTQAESERGAPEHRALATLVQLITEGRPG